MLVTETAYVEILMLWYRILDDMVWCDTTIVGFYDTEVYGVS